MEAFDYTQLEAKNQLVIVRRRIQLLESSHLELALRHEGLGPGETWTDDDQARLDQLTTALNSLHQLESELEASDQSQ